MKIRRWAVVAACAAGLSGMGVLTPSSAGAALHPIPGTYTIHEYVPAYNWTTFSGTLSANHGARFGDAVGTWKLTTLSTGAEKITITFHIKDGTITITTTYRATVTAAGFASLAHPGTYTTLSEAEPWYATLG